MSERLHWRKVVRSISTQDVSGNEILSIQMRKRKRPSKCKASGDVVAPLVRSQSKVASTSVETRIHPVSLDSTYIEDQLQCQPSTFSGEEELSNLLAYKLEVTKVQGIQPCSNGGHFFWLVDYNIEQKKLKEKNIIFIEAKKMAFVDGERIIFCCSSCDTLLFSLSDSIQETYLEFIRKFSFCIHSQCAKFFLEDFFTQEIMEEFNQRELEPISPNISFVELLDGICVWGGGSYGILIPSETNQSTEGIMLKCITCKYNTHDCAHVGATRNLEESSEEQLLIGEILYRKSLEIKNKQRKLTPVSKLKIPFEALTHSELRMIYEQDYHYFINSLNFENNVYVVEYSETQCANCQKIIPEEKLEFSVVNLFLRSSVVKCRVFHYVCICGTSYGFDGLEIGAINMGRYMVSHQLLWEYHDSFVLARSSFHAYYETLIARFERGNSYQNIRKMISYFQIKASWTHFLSLLDINYQDGFKCSICLEKPDVILCDGTTLGFKRKFLSWEYNKIENQEIRTVQYTKFSDRVFLKTTQARKLLGNFVSSKNVTKVEFQHLIGILKSEDTDASKTLASLLNSIVKNSENPCCPKNYKAFLEFLSKNSAVCATFPSSVQFTNLLDKLNNDFAIRQHPEEMKLLSHECPVLFNLIFSENLETLPQNLKRIIMAISNISKACFPPFAANETDFVSVDDLLEDTDRLACFPAISKKSKRGIYVADKSTDDKSCEKDFSGKHSILTPGIFTIYCEHGVCYGFQAMHKSESANIPFTILRTRFNESPRVIVYDFACGLQQYCLNRDPGFFKNTKFLIDRLHWKNHSGCSIGFCLETYSQYCSLNTQINEQVNSSLKKIKHILTFMNEKNFMSHCQLYLFSYNRKKLIKINQRKSSITED